MNEEELKKQKEWYEKAIVDLTKFSIHNNGLNPVQDVHLVDYKKMYLYLKKIEQLQNNWDELKKGLKSLFEFDRDVVSKDYLECAEDTLDKMQELEQGKDE